MKNMNQIPSETWKHVEWVVRKRKRNNKKDESEVLIDGIVQPPVKVRKETSRHFYTNGEIGE